MHLNSFHPFQHLILLSVVILQYVVFCQAENIVFLHNIGSYSHRVTFQPLAEQLALRGHKITYISVYKPPIANPNITDIQPLSYKKFYEETLDSDFDVTTRIRGEIPATIIFEKLGVLTCQELIRSEEIKQWLNQSPKIDLIFADSLPECGYGIAYKIKKATTIQPKVAIITPATLMPRYYDMFGFSDECSSLPTIDSYGSAPLSFVNRIKCSAVTLSWYFYTSIYVYSLAEEMLKEELQIPDLPSMHEFEKNTTLVLQTGNFVIDYQRAMPPNFIKIGGLHVKETHDPLPQDIEAFINSVDENQNASTGFVYISLGTIVQAAYLPDNFKSVFFNSIKSFPHIRFFWKWGGEKPKNAPKNLFLSKWFPQQDLLGHPKIRAFITQAGRPSTQEAVFNGVPMITIPILGDQDLNANRLENLGVSINMELGDITTKTLTNAISDIFKDISYKEKAKYYAKLFRDLPMKPIDTAVWWTEYLLRHDDISHLKSLGRHQTWYQRRFIDVYIFLTFAFIAIVLLLTYSCRLCYRLIVKIICLMQPSSSSNKLKTS